MITNETMQAAKDVAEAGCLLSNYYKENGVKNRSVSVCITAGQYPTLRLIIGEFSEENGTFNMCDTLEILLDDEHKFGNTFEQAAEAIKREMERVENG